MIYEEHNNKIVRSDFEYNNNKKNLLNNSMEINYPY